jgi:hypothetical protein
VSRLEEVENAGDAEFGGELLDPHRNSFFSASSLLIAARLRNHKCDLLQLLQGNESHSACSACDLIEAKMKGLAVKPRAIVAPPPVIDLMAALKRSLAQARKA